MSEKIAIEKGSVQETLLVPLYGRKLCAEQFPELYNDTSAAELLSHIDYDFSEHKHREKNTLYQFGALEAAMRQLDMEWEIKDYLSTHPNAAVVNLGCGLDQTPRRCDNGTCLLYNLDMPDIIAARAELLPEVERERNIACDLNDFAWMDEIDGSQGAIFFAAGVFHYFTTEQIRAIVRVLDDRFPGSRLVFDAVNKFARDVMMKGTLKNLGMNDVSGLFCLRSVDEIRDWVPSATVSSRGYMLGYYDMRSPGVTGFQRFLARICDSCMKMTIYRFDFAQSGD